MSLIFRHLGFWSLSCRPTVSLVVPSQAVDWCICFTRKNQQGGDWERTRPQGPINVHNFLVTACATSELSMPAWNWNVADSKKTYFRPDHGPYFPIWHSKKCPTILYAVNLWQPLGLAYCVASSSVSRFPTQWYFYSLWYLTVYHARTTICTW